MRDTFYWIADTYPWVYAIFAGVIGACIGSFLNVVIYRLPAGRSIVSPGSTCACGQPIRWHDNVPILSWFFLGGRARCCGARFSFRYPLVEALTAFLFVTCWLRYAPPVAGVGMLFVAGLVAMSFIDLDTMEIPDTFSIGGFIVGLAFSFLVPALHGQTGDYWLADSLRAFLAALQGGLISSALLLWIALVAEVFLRKETMGDGDIKLMGAIGAFCGWQGGVFAIFAGAVFGTLAVLALHLIGLVRPPRARPRPDALGATGGSFLSEGHRLPAPEPSASASSAPGEDSPDGSHRIPFGPALAAGALLYFLVWRQPVDAFFADFQHVLYADLH